MSLGIEDEAPQHAQLMALKQAGFTSMGAMLTIANAIAAPRQK